MTGRIALGPLDAAARVAFVGRSKVIDSFHLPESTWEIAGLVCVGAVDSATSLADALEAAVRGADLIVTIATRWHDAFLDDADRAGLTIWIAPRVDPTAEWVALLDELANGRSIAEAARLCLLSQRSAYRRLEEARIALGAPTNTAAVASWARRRRGSDSAK